MQCIRWVFTNRVTKCIVNHTSMPGESIIILPGEKQTLQSPCHYSCTKSQKNYHKSHHWYSGLAWCHFLKKMSSVETPCINIIAAVKVNNIYALSFASRMPLAIRKNLFPSLWLGWKLCQPLGKRSYTIGWGAQNYTESNLWNSVLCKFNADVKSIFQQTRC